MVKASRSLRAQKKNSAEFLEALIFPPFFGAAEHHFGQVTLNKANTDSFFLVFAKRISEDADEKVY